MNTQPSSAKDWAEILLKSIKETWVLPPKTASHTSHSLTSLHLSRCLTSSDELPPVALSLDPVQFEDLLRDLRDVFGRIAANKMFPTFLCTFLSRVFSLPYLQLLTPQRSQWERRPFISPNIYHLTSLGLSVVLLVRNFICS